MNAVTFDTHAAVQELKSAGIDERHAEKLVEVFSHAIGEPATKTDIATLATKADIARIEARIAESETRLTWRLVGAMVAIGAILRFLN